jgi:hypothetical protein
MRKTLLLLVALAVTPTLLVACNPESSLTRLHFGRTAIVTGDFDTVEQLIQEVANTTTVEAEIHMYDGYVDGPHFETEVGANAGDLALQVEDLLRAETTSGLDQFNTVFLSCGMRGVSDHVYNGVAEDSHLVLDDTVIQHLVDAASHGTSLYFSDWTYDFIEKGWPEKVAWVGDQDELDIAQAGAYGPINARIVHEELAAFMEVPVGTELEIDFNQSGWAVPRSVADDVDVLVSGDVVYDDPYTGEWTALEDVPLVFSFTTGGQIVYTAFHNEAQITDDARDVLRFALTRLSDR